MQPIALFSSARFFSSLRSWLSLLPFPSLVWFSSLSGPKIPALAFWPFFSQMASNFFWLGSFLKNRLDMYNIPSTKLTSDSLLGLFVIAWKQFWVITYSDLLNWTSNWVGLDLSRGWRARPGWKKLKGLLSIWDHNTHMQPEIWLFSGAWTRIKKSI